VKLAGALALLKRAPLALAGVAARAVRRVYQVYFAPMNLFEEVRVVPEALPAAFLLFAALAIQTLVQVQFYQLFGLLPEAEAYKLYQNLPFAILLRAMTVFVLWFMLFIISWFVIYVLGSRVEGYVVFSSVGYILSSSLLPFAIYALVYALVAATTPELHLAAQPGVYPRFAPLVAYMYRIEYASSRVPLNLSLVLDASRNLGTIWQCVLTLLAFKIVGDLSWKRAAVGASIAVVAAWIVASLFSAAGLL